MAVSTYKGYELIATGTQTDNWGNVQNAQQIVYIDQNLGGIVTKSLTNVNVTLTSDESRNAILRLVGVLTGAVIITTECLGFFFVENATTGIFTVTIRNSLIATSTTAPQGQRVVIISDQTNGCRVAGTGDFPTGTRMPFQQTSVPTGWTKESAAAYNDAAIKLTTGPVSTGGTKVFSDTFTARPILQANLPIVSLSSSDLSISGSITLNNATSVLRVVSGSVDVATGGSFNWLTSTISASHNLDVAGTVPLGGSGTAMDFAVKYAEFSIGIKN